MGMHIRVVTTHRRMVAQPTAVFRLAVRILAVQLPLAAPPPCAHGRGWNRRSKSLRPAALPFGHCLLRVHLPSPLLGAKSATDKTQTVCFCLTGHKYHHCCPPPPNGSSTLFATIYDLFQGPVTGAKEGGGPGKGLPCPPPPPRKPIFPHPIREKGRLASGGIRQPKCALY